MLKRRGGVETHETHETKDISRKKPRQTGQIKYTFQSQISLKCKCSLENQQALFSIEHLGSSSDQAVGYFSATLSKPDWRKISMVQLQTLWNSPVKLLYQTR